jgi:putative DNA primase/helicase
MRSELPTPQEAARLLGGEVQGNRVIAPGPGHSPQDRSLSIKFTSEHRDGFVVHSFAGDDDLACKDYVRNKLGLNGGSHVNSGIVAAKPIGARSIAACYDYVDEVGKCLFQVVRYEPKGFSQRKPDGRGGWLWKRASRLVPYRLPQLIEAVALEQTVFIAEGEKAVDALVDLGVPATCSPGGAEKWKIEYSAHLKGAHVVILPDHDGPGARHAQQVKTSLDGIAASVTVLPLPGLPEGGDAFDWIKAGGKADQLWALVERPPQRKASEPEPPRTTSGGNVLHRTTAQAQADKQKADKYCRPDGTPRDPKAVIAEIKQLPELDYEKERRAAADSLGVRVTALDRLYRSSRPAGGFTLSDPEPWPDAVDGAQLLDEIRKATLSHLILPELADVAISLWVLLSHCHEAFRISPLLSVISPEPSCGKTQLLRLLKGLVPKPLSSSNITAATVFRAIEQWHPTLLIDEYDTYGDEMVELRGILNSGHCAANAFVIRTVGNGAGDFYAQTYSTWCPKALAKIGKLHPTLDSRSVVIEMQRMLPSELVESLDEGETDHLKPLCAKAARWAADHFDQVKKARPELPTNLYGRSADNWKPLLAIADVAGGGEWPRLARTAATNMGGRRSEQSSAIMLLEDIKETFDRLGVERVFTKDLIADLVDRDDRPWAEWAKGHAITGPAIARLLVGSRWSQAPSGLAPQPPRDTASNNSGRPSTAISRRLRNEHPIIYALLREGSRSVTTSQGLGFSHFYACRAVTTA